jgi:proteasome lid subunit RPN8/RPN11
MLTFSEIQSFKKKLSGHWNPTVELCGVITSELEIEEKTTRAEDPNQRFEFELCDLEGTTGTWHSHPTGSANLSIDDYRFFQSWSNQTHFIISSNEVRCYLTCKGVVYLIDEEKDHPTWPPGRKISP